MTKLTKLLGCVHFPIDKSLQEPSTKINVLLQAYISQLKPEGLEMTYDMVFIAQGARRLLRALFEIVLKRGWAQLAEKALNLFNMVTKGMWSVQTALHQFNGIPSDEFIHQFPKLNLAAHVQPITRTVLGVELTITPDFAWYDRIHGYVEPFWVIVEDNDREYILHHEYFLLKKQYIEEAHTLNFTVPIYEPLPPQYFIRVVSDKWLGSQTVLPVSFRHLILPEKYPPPTELLDLQPLPVTALRNPSYEALYQEFNHFNPGDTGHGMHAVYVTPIKARATERCLDWKKKFGGGLVLKVVELTGHIATDLKLLRKGQLIISTLEMWDHLSRPMAHRWLVLGLSLFIIDGLHLIGDQRQGGVLEKVVSRTRCIANHVASVLHKIRFMALSTSLANANDLGEWIGATSHGIFIFPLGISLQFNIQEVDVANFEARMQAMTKPTY
ncbi:hypothetical protein TSUD_55730 [Trifolium subterraneum]|uniref:SEC63 domain-containing protein n=1 Tax=Trifolium subterraneum TaxID=3900 RepID=A0A2Z6NAA8_TRISU|nr:hypothetical protein TSUD_55730 [Trifolium subterraneum]